LVGRETNNSGSDPPLQPGLALFGAVIAISFAGPIVRFSSADALAISAWRLAFSVVFIGLVMALRRSILGGVRLSAAEWALAGVAGLLLAGHFWAWTAAIQYTTIASTAVLVSTQPLFVAIFSVLFLKESPLRRQWLGIAIAVIGAAAIGWGDFGVGGTALFGDALALFAAVLAAGYFTIGRNLRKRLDLWGYTGTVYGTAAVILMLAVMASPRIPVSGYPAHDWMVFLALAAVPMMLGHTGINYALGYLPAYVANLAMLGEPVGATLIAWALPAIREVPTAQTVLGGALVLVGIALGTITPRPRARPDGLSGV
jgi:drug/metabolite transporter (DMT)-like permease